MKYKNQDGVIYNSDCIDTLQDIEKESIHLILTDPPYFIDGMGDDWDNEKLQSKINKAGVIGGRPIGMKFDTNQGRAFQKFISPILIECFRLLKPGGFLISFSQARLYHRLAVAAEDCDFEIRDMLAWQHNGQAKAFTQDHFVQKRKDLSNKKKKEIIRKLDGRKTPQLKPQLEPMILAQKPKQGTFVDNWIKHEVGLIDTKVSLDGAFPGNLMPINRPDKLEKGKFNFHFTVKPVNLLSHLIKIFTLKNQIVLDPFIGSGSTAIAAILNDRKFIGVERDPKYYEICKKRIQEVNKNNYHLKEKQKQEYFYSLQ